MVRRPANSTPSRENENPQPLGPRFRGDERKRPRGPGAAVATGSAAAEKFFGNRGTPREVAHCCWRNELYDPLSSFVPELEPCRRRGFSFGRGHHRRKPRPCLETAPSPSAAGYRGR